MKINKFIKAGVAACVGLIPTISSAIYVGRVQHSSTEVNKTVTTVVNPESMNIIENFYYNHPILGLAALGLIIGYPLMRFLSSSLSDSNEKENKKIKP